MGVIKIENDSQFNIQLSTHYLVVADFSATWCYPCLRIAPVFEQLSEKYPQGVFLKIDVDVCQELASAHNVTSMPTFIFYKNGKSIDRFCGANPQLLEEKINHYFSCDSGENLSVREHCDLFPFIKESDLEALNESDNYPLINCFEDNDSFLQSDCDGQLLISIGFKQAVKVHSIMIKAPETYGPKTIKLFTNQPTTLDFERAQTNSPVQSIETNMSDLVTGNSIPLQFVKFQNVHNIQIFVQDNHDRSDVTRIDRLRIFGSPNPTVQMEHFKGVAGNKDSESL